MYTNEAGHGCPKDAPPSVESVMAELAAVTRELEHTRRAYDIARAAHATLERDWNAWRPLVPRLESDLATVTAERDALRAELAALRRYPVPPTPEVLGLVAALASRGAVCADVEPDEIACVTVFRAWVEAYRDALVAGDATDGVNVPTMEGV